MDYYFEDKKNQKRLREILISWENTPFKHHTGVKNLGVDCIHLVACVYSELGILKMPKIPEYPNDWHLHQTRELLLEKIVELTSAQGLRFDQVSFEPPLNGDLMTFFYGKAASHAAIYFDGYIYQAVTGVGVVKVFFRDPMWYNRKVTNFRLRSLE